MPRILSPFGLVLLLAACATEINTAYIQSMNHYIGKPEAYLIDKMGVPDKSYKIDGGPKLVTYTRVTEREVSRAGFGASTCIGHYNRFGYGTCIDTTPTRVLTFYCDITFTIEKRRVQSWRQEGNDCPRIQ